ncbi:MAG: general secretion pathway protein GspB [Nitrosomonadales bacterium]|nr:general secretion pathway protein GspB [Nitrosomonadales bacterium]
MSYILDALKKSDRQRQRGAPPSLQSAQATVAAPSRTMSAYYGLFAALLLVIGIVIGLLRPWQPEQTPPEATLHGAEIIAAASPAPNSRQAMPVPVAAPPVMPVSNPTPAVQSAPGAQAQDAVPLEALPLPIQQEIPAMTVQLHAYASEPGERLASINSIRLHEGGYLMAGLRLEQITPEGMIFSYKGYRFRRGIR